MDRTVVKRGRASSSTGDLDGLDQEVAQPSADAVTEAVAVLRCAGTDVGISLAAARGIAARAHEGQLDANGEPHICHVGRVAAGVPLFARAVGWLHEVVERSEVDESALIAAGATPEQCVALRLLGGDERESCDDAFLERARAIALLPGAAGRIARAVKRADLLDHVLHRAARSEVRSPPYGAALVAMMLASASSAIAGSRLS
jgi:hypothetical protein